MGRSAFCEVRGSMPFYPNRPDFGQSSPCPKAKARFSPYSLCWLFALARRTARSFTRSETRGSSWSTKRPATAANPTAAVSRAVTSGCPAAAARISIATSLWVVRSVPDEGTDNDRSGFAAEYVSASWHKKSRSRIDRLRTGRRRSRPEGRNLLGEKPRQGPLETTKPELFRVRVSGRKMTQ